MNSFQTLHRLGVTFTLFLACTLCMSSASAALFWKVTRGDTLFAISRTLYPGDLHKQKQLREDISQLNPAAFANGPGSLAVGVVLKLPDYVVVKSKTQNSGEPANVLKRNQTSPQQPVSPAPLVKPKPAPAKVPETIQKPAPEPVSPVPVAQAEPETPDVSRQTAATPSHSEGKIILSLGYSFGGDELVSVDGGLDFNAGSGGHLRLGYEQMPQHGGGYRAALGLQYNKVTDATYRDTYLHLAYQYSAYPIVYGIGIVADTGAKFESFGDTTEFDPALGGIVYLEYLGSSNLAGWGLSYTSLDIDEKDSGASMDASRAEVYYNWRF
jgi:hypothetical protein